jgi:hypothetical protein
MVVDHCGGPPPLDRKSTISQAGKSGKTHLYGQVDFVRIIGDFLSPREMELLSFGTQHPSLHRTAGNWLTRCGPLKAILADEMHEGRRLIRLRRSRRVHASGRLCGGLG